MEDPGKYIEGVAPALKEHARLEDRHAAVGGEAQPDVLVWHFNETIRVKV